MIIADEVIGLASRPEPDYALLGPALETLGLCDEDFDDLALEAVRGGKGGAAMAARVAELERQARVDDLTGVLNRRHWMATVRRAVADHEPGSVLICDIDHFKAVNDGHGHATGDLVLTEVARHLSSQGVVGRLGGDEFAVWVPGTPRRGDEAASAVLDAVAATFAGEQSGLAGRPLDRHRQPRRRRRQPLRGALARRRGAVRGQARRSRPRRALLGLELQLRWVGGRGRPRVADRPERVARTSRRRTRRGVPLAPPTQPKFAGAAATRR